MARDASRHSGNDPSNIVSSLVVAFLIAGGVWLLAKHAEKDRANAIFQWVFAIILILLLYLNPW